SCRRGEARTGSAPISIPCSSWPSPAASEAPGWPWCTQTSPTLTRGASRRAGTPTTGNPGRSTSDVAAPESGGPAGERDRLAVRRRARRDIPLVLAGRELVLRDEILLGHELLEGSEPVVVVARAIVVLAASARGGDLGGQALGPLHPREVTALVQHHRHAEGLGFPRLAEDGALLVAPHAVPV